MWYPNWSHNAATEPAGLVPLSDLSLLNKKHYTCLTCASFDLLFEENDVTIKMSFQVHILNKAKSDLTDIAECLEDDDLLTIQAIDNSNLTYALWPNRNIIYASATVQLTCNHDLAVITVLL